MTDPVIATPYVVAMTETGAVVTHLVTENAVAAGRRAGRYAGVCGAVVLLGSLQDSTDRCCRACRDWVAAQ